MLNVGTWELNIVAQKGLVYGNLELLMSSGDKINCNERGKKIRKFYELFTKTMLNFLFLLFRPPK